MAEPSPFIHPAAIVEPGAVVGPGTRVWAFVHVLPGARVGRDCNLCDHVFIESDVVVGDRVTIKSGVQLWSGIVVEDDVFIGPNATFTNDPWPRSKRHLPSYPTTVVRKAASIGANATILPGRTIGTAAMVGAGAVITRDVPPNAIVRGNPGRIEGYTSSRRESGAAPPSSGARETTPTRELIAGAVLHRVVTARDAGGSLAAGELGRGLPFLPERYFVVYDVPSTDLRRQHAHRNLHQFLTCITGSCRVAVDNGRERAEVDLDSPAVGLHIHPMIWATQYKYTPDAVLLVLASAPYDADDYIRDYDTWKSLTLG